jgi:hypothetical protein
MGGQASQLLSIVGCRCKVGRVLPADLSDLSAEGAGFCQGRAVRPRRRRPRRGGLDRFRPRSYRQHRLS